MELQLFCLRVANLQIQVAVAFALINAHDISDSGYVLQRLCGDRCT